MSDSINPVKHHFDRGSTALRRRDADRARAHFLAAHTMASPLVSGHALRGLAQTELMVENGDRAIELLAIARQAYVVAAETERVLHGPESPTIVDATEGQATCYVMEVDVHFQAGRYDAAQRALDAAYPLYRNITGRRSNADLWSATARLAQHQQRWTTAGVAWQKVITIAEEHHDEPLQCHGWLRLAEVRLRDTDLDAMDECLDRAEPMARDLEDASLLGRLWSARAAVAAQRDELEAAWDMALDALDHLADAPDKRLVSSTRLRMAGIAETARPAEVVPLLRDVLDLERERPHSDLLAPVAHRAASYALSLRKPAEALLAARAEEGLAPTPHHARLVQVRALLALGEDLAAAWLAAYQARTVGEEFPAAVALAAALGDRLPTDDDDSSFERVATEALPRRDHVVVRIARQRGVPLEQLSTARGIELVLEALAPEGGAVALANPEAAVPAVPTLVWTDALDRERSLAVPVGVTTIGRSRTNAVQIAWDATVARSHAAIERIGNTVTVRDLGSDAGSIVNGSPLEGEAVLVAGDELVIGHTPFRLEERKSAALVAVQAAPAAVAAAAAPA